MDTERRILRSPDEENDADLLTLSLFNHPTPTPPPPPPPPPPPYFTIDPTLLDAQPPPYANIPRRRPRRNPTRTPPAGKDPTILPPFPWSTNLRAGVHNLDYLLAKEIRSIRGDVQCRRCERNYSIEFDLVEKFRAIASFIEENKGGMHHRAPRVWLSPALPRCVYCDQENAVRPVVAEKKRSINWLFLLLGQMLGCCTLEQLKYFCKHTRNHRTGAKDRVLYLTYLGLCRQLDPRGPFDI